MVGQGVDDYDDDSDELQKRSKENLIVHFPQCGTHTDGTALGILCGPLCAERSIHSLACESLHSGKEAVFTAHWEATRLVFKASRLALQFP